MKIIIRFLVMAVLSCIPLGIAAQDVITRPKKSAKKVTAPAKKQKATPILRLSRCTRKEMQQETGMIIRRP